MLHKRRLNREEKMKLNLITENLQNKFEIKNELETLIEQAIVSALSYEEVDFDCGAVS